MLDQIFQFVDPEVQTVECPEQPDIRDLTLGHRCRRKRRRPAKVITLEIAEPDGACLRCHFGGLDFLSDQPDAALSKSRRQHRAIGGGRLKHVDLDELDKRHQRFSL